MAIVLNINVEATPDADNEFIPALLTITIGQPNDDMQTCDVEFILRDDGSFDNTIYKSLQRIHKGIMAIPLSLISMLLNQDGSYNLPVINQVLSQSKLMLNPAITEPVSAG